MKANNERGVAIVLALFLITVMSVLGVSMMFLSQTETYASMNYRMMSQARYGGEAGVQKAADFILDSAQYDRPGAGEADEITNYNTDVSPVRWIFNDQPVVLSTDDAEANYPVAAVQAAFKAAAAGTLAAGNTDVSYNARAELVTMQEFTSFAGTERVVQTWRITGIGGLSGAREATVEVEALIESPKVPANNYAAFAIANTCGALYFHGNPETDSYDSAVGGDPDDSIEASGGDVGTNGNLLIEGSASVQGNLYTPRTGVGDCDEGAVTALSGDVADVTGSVVQLPGAVRFPTPELPPDLPRNLVTLDAANAATACAALLAAVTDPAVTCTRTGTTFTLDGGGALSEEVLLPSISVASGYKLEFVGRSPSQVFNVNSIAGSGELEVKADTGDEGIVLKVAGLEADNVTEMATPIDFSTMSWKQNKADGKNFDASMFQLVYAGTQTLSMDGGNSQSAMSIYAPNAHFDFQGTQDLFGSITAKTIEAHGNPKIHYDRSLAGKNWIAGQPMIGTFSWKRY